MVILATIGIVSCQSNSVELKLGYEYIGDVQKRSALDIESSPISIGGETLDRDYADYHNYKEYLDSLGVKKIRLQAGWAKTEKERGIYNWKWLDSIVFDTKKRGIEPWLQTSYGNPIYPKGGGANLAGGFPNSVDALSAWDNWVDAMAKRYKNDVKIWEIWNEPDLRYSSTKNPPEEYLELYIRTVKIIKKHIPNARIYALSLAQPYKTEYTKVFLEGLKNQGKLDWVDDITFHGYVFNPSEAYPRLRPLKDLVASYKADIRLHQGEQGAPSTYITSGALKNYQWTETSQAKWALRRLIGDLGHGYQTLYFTIADLNYGKNADTHIKNTNTKGLLKADKGNRILYAKPAYNAVQNLCAVMDSTFLTIPKVSYTASLDSTYSVHVFNKKATHKNLVSVWFNGKIPSDTTKITKVDLVLKNVSFKNPIYLDLMSGNVMRMPEESWRNEANGVSFKGLPITDYPIFIADRDLISVQNSQSQNN